MLRLLQGGVPTKVRNSLVELTLDGLTQLDIVDVAQDEDRPEDLAEALQGPVEGVLLACC
jgi:hypothetical protein